MSEKTFIAAAKLDEVPPATKKLVTLNGIEVLRRLKSEESTRFVPVVMLTSSAEDRDLQECYRLGVNSYLVKPVDFGHFAEAVATLGIYWTAMNRLPG